MPSGRRRQQPNRPAPVFFLDRGLGRRLIAEAIRAKGYEALPMTDVFPDGADQRISDPEWIMRAGREGWIALTKDYAIIRDHRDVWPRQPCGCSPNNANLTGSEMVDRLEINFNRIVQRATKPGPFVYVIGRKGLESRWRPS